jgi:hypothetical protein
VPVAGEERRLKSGEASQPVLMAQRSPRSPVRQSRTTATQFPLVALRPTAKASHWDEEGLSEFRKRVLDDYWPQLYDAPFD